MFNHTAPAYWKEVTTITKGYTRVEPTLELELDRLRTRWSSLNTVLKRGNGGQDRLARIATAMKSIEEQALELKMHIADARP